MKKTLTIILAFALVIAMSVAGTVAYLTSQDSVANTFTVGKVKITLDEAKVDTNGAAVTSEGRVKANSYKLIPGHTYTKDPIIHVDANSEKCWLFVKVENGISAIEDSANSAKTIAAQLAANGWSAVNGAANVYAYKESVAAPMYPYLAASRLPAMQMLPTTKTRRSLSPLTLFRLTVSIPLPLLGLPVASEHNFVIKDEVLIK